MESSRPAVSPTPLGRLVLTAAIAAVALGSLFLSLVPLLAGLLGLVAWGLERGRTRRELEGLRTTRALPRRAWTGRSFAIEATLERAGDATGPLELEFRDSFSPRTLVRPVFPAGQSILPIRYAARRDLRGRFRPSGWSASSQGPLGWFEAKASGSFAAEEGPASTETGVIDVLPSPFLPPRLVRHLDGRLAAGHHVTGFPEPIAEFRLLREFRPGDPIRGIHWPASLRSGDLLVREPDPPRPAPRRFGILLHSLERSGDLVVPESFERILRIVSGLLVRFRQAEVEVHFVQAGKDPTRLRHSGDFDEALVDLAVRTRVAFAGLDRILEAATTMPECDEIFLLSDSPRDRWESSLRPRFRTAHAIDPTSLSLSPRQSRRGRGSSEPERRLAS